MCSFFLNNNVFRCFVLYVLIQLTASDLYAQRPPFGSGGSNNFGSTPSSTTVEDDGPDTTIYTFFLLNDIYKKMNVSDTAADIKFLKRFSLSKNNIEHVSTGNLGAASYSLILQPQINTGFTSGYDQYQIYHINLLDFRFYEQNRPLTDLYFSQLGSQDNINVGANFSRNFKNGLSVSLNYQRVLQAGLFTGQNTRATAFGVALRYKSANERYNGFLVFLNNANEESHMGGILNEDDLTKEFKKNIPKIIENANTRQQERSISFVQYYSIHKAKNDWQVYFQNTTSFKPSYFKFTDVDISNKNDSTFYAFIPFEKRGIRRYVNINQFSNGLFIHGDRNKGIKGKLGLKYDYYQIDDQILNTSRSDLTASFDGSIPFLKSLNLDTKAEVGLLSNIGNFDLSGQLNIQLSKIAFFRGGLRFFRSEPSYNQRRLILNETLILNAALTKPLGSSLHAEIEIPKLKFGISLSQTIINNPVFWDTMGLATSFDDILNVLYLKVKQDFKFWGFHINNQAHFQIQSNDLYPVPRFFSTHQLYVNGRWFKKVLDVSFGIDARLITKSIGAKFQPIFGSFALSNTELPFFPAANLFFTAKVSAFKAMFVMENFGQYFVEKPNFDVLRHPQFDPTFRFGFQWLLKD